MWLASVTAVVRADDWPQWRGPQRDGRSAETGLLKSWPAAGPPLAWRTSGVGTGYASVVTAHGRVFTLGARGRDVVVSGLDEQTGERLWSRVIGQTDRNPCSTPTIDGDRLYALGPDGQLVCLRTTDGETLWQRDLVTDFGGRLMSGRGYGESPLIDSDRLICTPGGAEAQLVALDKTTGAVVWKSAFGARGAGGRAGAAFSSAVISQAAGVRQYVQLHGQGLVGIAADDGRLLWHFHRITNQTANIPTPVVFDDFVFAANGYNAGAVLLKVSREAGGESAPKELQVAEVYFLAGGQFQNHHGGVVRVGDQLYGGHGSNNGLPTCLDLATGEILWKRRGPGAGSAAVTWADERFYFRYQDGLVALLAADAEGFQVTGTLRVPGAGNDSWAHPVVSNGRLLLREQDELGAWTVAERGQPTADTGHATRGGPRALRAVRWDQGAWVASAAGWTHRLLPGLEPAEAAEDAGRDWKSAVSVALIEPKQLVQGRVPAEILASLAKPPGEWLVSLVEAPLTAEGLRELAGLPGVVGLQLDHCRRLDDAALGKLAGATPLRWLGLAGTSVTGEGLRSLAQLPRLQVLDLDLCEGVDDAAVATLAGCRALRALSLGKTGFEKTMLTDAGLSRLVDLPDLRFLNLAGNRITDAGLAELTRFPQLQSLDLSLLPITDRGVATLTGLEELRELTLLFGEGFAGPVVTDEAVRSLQALTRLEALDLTGTGVTDAGWENLTGFPALRVLKLSRSKLTAAGKQRVQQQHPTWNVVP
jgi:outer membrane protein assembly factor BamB